MSGDARARWHAYEHREKAMTKRRDADDFRRDMDTRRYRKATCIQLDNGGTWNIYVLGPCTDGSGLYLVRWEDEDEPGWFKAKEVNSVTKH